MWILVCAWTVWLSACASLSRNYYDYREFYERPLEKQTVKDGEGIFRLRIAQAGDPIYLIKVKTLRDGKANVYIRTTKRGYKVRGGKQPDKRYSIKASKAATTEFLNVLETYDVWNQADADIYEYGEVSTGAEFIDLDGRSDDRRFTYDSYYPHIRKDTPRIAMAFHEIAGFDEKDEWTFYDHLKAHAESESSYADE